MQETENAKLDGKVSNPINRQGLGDEVGWLRQSGNMLRVNELIQNKLPNTMTIHLDMFHPFVKNRVTRNVNRVLTITKNETGG